MAMEKLNPVVAGAASASAGLAGAATAAPNWKPPPEAPNLNPPEAAVGAAVGAAAGAVAVAGAVTPNLKPLAGEDVAGMPNLMAAEITRPIEGD